MPTIFINKKNSYIPQYNFEKIELHQKPMKMQTLQDLMQLLNYE